MSFSVIYLFNRLIYRIFEFLRHWYVNSFFIITRKTINVLEYLDRWLALKITFRNWFKPLYQDYTILGYIMGFILRTLRIFIGGIAYFFVIVIAGAAYLAWASLPAYILIWGKIV